VIRFVLLALIFILIFSLPETFVLLIISELFNYMLIGGENAVDICKMQRLVDGEGITNRTRQVSVS
jgi:hypothetical protein